eukprot:364164-Chlamydomonas_euryale.AAC.8
MHARTAAARTHLDADHLPLRRRQPAVRADVDCKQRKRDEVWQVGGAIVAQARERPQCQHNRQRAVRAQRVCASAR